MRGILCVPSEFRRDAFCNIEVLVMEFQIKTLAQHFEELNVSNGLRLHHAMIAAQAAINLLFMLHSKRIIHRDIKPDNFMYNV